MSRQDAIARGATPHPTVPSMKRRSHAHDYEEPGIYMLTLAVEGRRRLLGTLTGKADAEEGTPDAPRVILSPLGKEVEMILQSIPQRHPELEIWLRVIMEDHLHLLVRVKTRLPKHLGQVVAGFKAACSKAYWRHLGLPPSAPNPPASSPVPPTSFPAPSASSPALPASFPAPSASSPASSSALQRAGSVRVAEAAGKRPSLFEPGYHDRLLLRAGQLTTLKRYIADNPRRLAVKRQHPQLFRKRLHIRIGSQEYAAYGNIFLLRKPDKAQVLVHRADSPAVHAAHMQEWQQLILNGGVLVSPFISQREKEARDMARQHSGDLIILRENGFPDIFKPQGWEFPYCAAGHLLLLAPWPHHNERTTITRRQCLSLNDMARAIAAITDERAVLLPS